MRARCEISVVSQLVSSSKDTSKETNKQLQAVVVP